MVTLVLLLHGLLAVLLIGAVTHQVLAGAGTATARRIDAAAFSRIVIVLFVLVVLGGALLYPSYRLMVRPVLKAEDLRAANGAFELKEHFAALGLALLPAYWACWRRPLLAELAVPRRVLSWVLAGFVWWNFLVGHLLVIVKGLFA